MTIIQKQLDRYNEDGFLIIEGLFDDADLQPVIDEIEQAVDGMTGRLFEGGRIKSLYTDLDFYTRMAAVAADDDESPGLLQMSTPMGPALAALWSSDVLLDIVERMIGPDIEGGAIWNVRPKVPENALMTVPWHQDSGYLAPTGQDTAQPACWIPLLDVNEENGCMQMVRGGHRPRGNAPHQVEKKASDPRSWYLFIDEEDLPGGEVVTCEMKKGSVLFVNENTPHRGLRNRSQKIRWAIDIRWQRPSDPTGLEGVLIRGPRMRRGDDPNFRPDIAKWAEEEREKYDAWINRTDVGSLVGSVDGSWYFARWDEDFRASKLEDAGA